jgi:hypothetical protein
LVLNEFLYFVEMYSAGMRGSLFALLGCLALPVCSLGSIHAGLSSVEQVKIGNTFDFAPNGVAFVVKDLAGFVLDPGGEYYAGDCTADNSYHSTVINDKTAQVRFEWGRVGNCIVGRFLCDQDVALPIRLLQPWPNWISNFSQDGLGWKGIAPAVAPLSWSVVSDPALVGTEPAGLTLNLRANVAAHLVAGIGTLPRLRDVESDLDRARSRYEKGAMKSAGDWGNFAGAIYNNLGNSRIYSNDDHRVAISVSRRWADSANTEPYFCWDSFFNGALACLSDPKAARETVRAILAWQTPEGLVPNFGHWNFSGGRVSKDRSQPPVGALCVWKIQQRWPNRAFLAEVYPKLLKWHRWWPVARDGRHDGLLEWGSSAAGKQGALWETGWDDTVEYEGAKMVGATLNAYAVDLNSLWAMDADYLARIADELGRKSEAQELRTEREKTLGLINERLWNPQLGIYCSRLWSGEFLTRLTPMNFYPLIAGAADAERGKQVLNVIEDPARFWGAWILPTVAYNDPVWTQQDYWRGKVWGPVNYLVWQGLQQYADTETLSHFADRSVDLFMQNWNSNRACGENYLSSTGKQSSDPHYTWGSLLCLIGVEGVCRIEPDGSVLLDGRQGRTISIDNLPIHGKIYSLRCSPNQVLLLNGSRQVAAAEGRLLRLKL